MSRHRGRSRLPRILGAAGALALVGALVAVIVHDAAERVPTSVTTVTASPSPAVTKTVSPPARVVPRDALARGFKPLAKLAKGDRVINEQNPSRPLCTFQLWDGSIAQAVIECGKSTRQIYVKTGYLTPVEPVK